MTASTKNPNKKTKRKQNIEQNNLHINCEIAIVGARAVCSLLISEITFLTLVDITAVSWLTAGLTKWNGVLFARALGLVAGTEVASALGWYGGAAFSRRLVALGEDWTLGAGRHLQIGARHPSTPQLFCKKQKHTHKHGLAFMFRHWWLYCIWVNTVKWTQV